MKTMNMISRRSFLKATAAAAVVSALGLTGCGSSGSSAAASSTASSAAGSAAAASEAGQTFKVGIVNYVDHASLNQIVASVESRLDKVGAEKGVTFDYADYYANAQADQSNLNQIGADLVADQVDVIVAVATPTAATGAGRAAAVTPAAGARERRAAAASAAAGAEARPASAAAARRWARLDAGVHRAGQVVDAPGQHLRLPGAIAQTPGPGRGNAAELGGAPADVDPMIGLAEQHRPRQVAGEDVLALLEPELLGLGGGEVGAEPLDLVGERTTVRRAAPRAQPATHPEHGGGPDGGHRRQQDQGRHADMAAGSQFTARTQALLVKIDLLAHAQAPSARKAAPIASRLLAWACGFLSSGIDGKSITGARSISRTGT